jgi:hypothetical protein
LLLFVLRSILTAPEFPAYGLLVFIRRPILLLSVLRSFGGPAPAVILLTLPRRPPSVLANGNFSGLPCKLRQPNALFSGLHSGLRSRLRSLLRSELRCNGLHN